MPNYLSTAEVAATLVAVAERINVADDGGWHRVHFAVRRNKESTDIAELQHTPADTSSYPIDRTGSMAIPRTPAIAASLPPKATAKKKTARRRRAKKK